MIPTLHARRQLLRSADGSRRSRLAVVGGEVLPRTRRLHRLCIDRPTLRFAQVSDSHIGFIGTANPDVVGSFAGNIEQINNLSTTNRLLVIHTGDLTHLATPNSSS